MNFFKIGITLFALFFVVGCSKNTTATDEPAGGVDKTPNLRAAGLSAKDLLSNEDFTKLKVEIAFVNGFKPTQRALNEFANYIRTNTFKEIVEISFLELDSPEKENLSIQEVADLEEANRTVYNNGETLGVYIYFSDAPAEGDDEDSGLVTLGAVYRNTSMVIYETTVRRLANSSASISNSDIEIATINHEFGHLFGLVNLGTEMVNNHEDENAQNHCNVSGCLMRAELEFRGASNKSSTLKNSLQSSCSLSGKSVLQMLKNRTSTTGRFNSVPLGVACKADLQAKGGR